MGKDMEHGTARTALWQGLYYAASGVWPLLHLPSFMRVTGPKIDTWLVRTVGALILASGGALALAGQRGRVTPELALLGTGQAVALTMVDTVYAAKGRISKIYLADASASHSRRLVLPLFGCRLRQQAKDAGLMRIRWLSMVRSRCRKPDKRAIRHAGEFRNGIVAAGRLVGGAGAG